MADQQLSNSSSAIARVSSNQPSYSYKSTAAVVGSCAYFCTALVKSFINSKVSTMSYINLSALSALSAVASVYASVQLPKAIKTMNNRQAMSKLSRKVNQAAARAARHRRQTKNGWVKSPTYQALCRRQNRFIPALPTVVRNGQPPVKVAIKYSRLSDGQGEYKPTPAVRVHKTFASPVRKVSESATFSMEFEKPKLVGEAQKLAKALKQKRKEAARVKSLTHFLKPKSPELAKAKQRLVEAERKAARLSEEVRASSEKKGKSKAKTGVSAGVETTETVDTILEQLEALKAAIDVNLYQDVAPVSHAQEAVATVADYKAAAEATGTADLEMSMGSKMPVTLEKVEWVEGMLLSVNKDNKQAIHNHLKGVRTYTVSFYTPTCTIRGAAEYLLNIGFQVHPTVPDLLWLAENTAVPALESPSSEKKEKREVKNKPSNGVTRLENFNENSQRLFVTDDNITSLHIVLAGKARGKHVLFNRAECTVEGASEYLLSLKFEVHPDADWLWLDKNLSVKPINGKPRNKKEERKEPMIKATLELAGTIQLDFDTELKSCFDALDKKLTSSIRSDRRGKPPLSFKDFNWLTVDKEKGQNDWQAVFVYATNTEYVTENAGITLGNYDYNWDVTYKSLQIEQALVQAMFAKAGMTIELATPNWELIKANNVALDLLINERQSAEDTEKRQSVRLVYTIQELVSFLQTAGASETLQKAVRGEANDGSLTEVDKDILSVVNFKLRKEDKITTAVVKKGDAVIAQWIDFVADKYGVDTLWVKPQHVITAEVILTKEYEPVNKLEITVDGVELAEAAIAPHKPLEGMDDLKNEQLWNQLGIADAVRQKVAAALSSYQYADVWFSYDTEISLEVEELLAEFGFLPKHDCFLLKPVEASKLDTSVLAVELAKQIAELPKRLNSEEEDKLWWVKEINAFAWTNAQVFLFYLAGVVALDVSGNYEDILLESKNISSLILRSDLSGAFVVSKDNKELEFLVDHLIYEILEVSPGVKKVAKLQKALQTVVQEANAQLEEYRKDFPETIAEAIEAYNNLIKALEVLVQHFSGEKKDKSIEKEEQPVTTTVQEPVVCTALVSEDGLKHYSNFLINEAYDKVWGEVVNLLNNPATNKTSFQTNGYKYTCLGNYYWVYKGRGSSEYLTTQPDGTAIQAIPAFLKGIVENLVNVTFKGIFDGEFVAESCLVNVYQAGNALNYHVDKTEEVDAPIVSLSLGVAGKFNIKDSWQPNAKVREFTLNKGDLFMFYGKHRKCIHSYAGNIEEGIRINLTVRMVKKPIVKQEESTTVQQTFKRPVFDKPTVADKPIEATQPAKQTETNCSSPSLSISTLVKKLEEIDTLGKLNQPEGLRSLFRLTHTPVVSKKSQVIVAVFSMQMEKGNLVKTNINVPKGAFSPEFKHYGTEDKHPIEADNLMSGADDSGNLPFKCSVSHFCVNGETSQFVPAIFASRSFTINKPGQPNLYLILDMEGATFTTKDGAVPGIVKHTRNEILEAAKEGKSVKLESLTPVKDAQGKVVKDAAGNPTTRDVFAELEYAEDAPGLDEVLKDGKRHLFIAVAAFDNDKVTYHPNNGKQFRIYPHTTEVLEVIDIDAVFSDQAIMNFCPYDLLGVPKPKAAATTKQQSQQVVEKAETRVEVTANNKDTAKPVDARRPEANVKQEAITTANVENELKELYKAVNLTFDKLTTVSTSDFGKKYCLKKYGSYTSEDEGAAKTTLDYIQALTKGNPVQYYSWSPEDVLQVLKVLTTCWNKKNNDVSTLSHYMTKEKELNINFGGATAILISNDGRAYDQEGRSFEQAIEVCGYHKLSSKEVLVDDKLLPQEVKTPCITLVKPASSTGKFMQAFCGFLLMLGNNKNNVRDGLAANFPQLLREGDDMFPLTLTEVLGQNGGFLHGLQNNMKVLIHRPFNPNIEFTSEQTAKLAYSTAFLMRGVEKGMSKKMWLAKGATEPTIVSAKELEELMKPVPGTLQHKVGSPLSDQFKGQVVKTLKHSKGGVENEVEQEAMLAAMPKYRSLGFHFSKGVFLAGITHVSLQLAQQYAPTLFNRMLLATGLKAKVAADYVVSLTLKASKGAKRATLSMAKAVHVVGEVEAGYKYYNQTKLLKGWLVQECMAPTFVMPPGMALFLGTEAEKPIGYFKKTERLVFADYTAGDNLPTAVTLKGQTIIEHCLDEYEEPIYSFDEIKGVHTLKFDEKPVVLFGTKLAWIPKEAGVWGSVEFTQHEKAELAEIRWFEIQTVGKATELAVEYDYYLTHRNPKLRGIIKAMMGQAKPEILYNAMNPNLKELGLGDIKLIAPQDTIKSDMLYSWLQVIGNTLRYSNPEAEAIKKLQEFKEQVHASLGLKAGLPYLVIEQYNVTALLYQPMVDYFEATFGRAIWMHVAECGDQGTIMTELYSRKVKAEFGWVDVPSSSNWGDEERALYFRLKAEGKKMGIIAESIDYANDPKQNAIIFVSKDDVLVEYYQRSYCFIGAENAPVYGVELFESSTVAEAISDSRHMASSVRSFSRMPGASAAEMFEAAKKLLDAGKESMFMSLVIAGMASGDSFDCSKVVKFISLKDSKKEIDSLSLAPADIAYLKELLAASDIDVTLAHHEKDLFKSVAHCFRDVVFDVAGKKLWLNALLAVASLKSEDSSQNISQKFFRDILVPCLNGVTVTTLEEKRVSGILDKLCDSKKTKELISAAGNVTGKRIALPNIPTGEIWVLYSSAPNSVCQKLARSGFKIDKIQSGEVTVFAHNSRAPLTDGPILKLRIIKDEENEANFYQINADSVGLSPISCAMDLGDFDGDGHYFVQLEGKFEATSFEENVEFLSKLLGYPMFNVFTNEKDEPNEEKDNLNEQYAADHYNIKPWEKVALTLSGTPKSVKSSKVTMTLDKYIDFNQKSREVQTKAVGIAHSIFMWSEHLVDILLAAQKLGIDIDHIDPKTGIGWSWSNAANPELVPGVAAMYEIILGGFSNPAWTVYSKYLKGLKEGERTVARPNLKEFNQDIVALGMAGDKPEGFLKLMLAAHQLFFLEKHGKFCDHILSNDVPTKMAVPQNIKQMLAVALVSFELLRGKFAGFNGVLADNKNPKATGHKVAMVMARTFLKENPDMIKESLVCYQLNQVIEECDWLLYGAEAEERSGRRAAGEVVPSKLQPHQLEYFRALAAKGIVEIEAETVDVEPVVETVEETVSWIEADILVTEEEDAASTERFFLLDEEVWEHEGRRYGVYTFHNQKDWTAFLNLEEEKPESIAYAKEFTNARLVKGRFVTPQRVVATPEIEAELPVEFSGCQEEYEECLVLSHEEEERHLFEGEPVEIESVVIEDKEQEEAHSVLKQLVEVKENLPADKWGDVLSFVRGLVAEVQAEAVKPVVVEPAVVEPVVQEAPKQNPLIQSLVSVVNKKHAYDSPEEVRVDGDRESLLGNPFKHDYRNEPLRAISVAAYGNYYNLVVYQGVEPVEAAQTVLRGLDNNFHVAKVWKKPTRKNFLSAIAQLWDKIEEHGFVEVKCWCSPKQCHLDVVKADLEEAGSRAVWQASIYVAPVIVEEPITAAELTEAEENEREAMSATCVEFVDVPKPNRNVTSSRGRQVATVEQPSVEKEPAAVPGLTEEEKQAPLAIAPDTQKDEEGGSPVVKRMPRPKSDGGGTAATVDEQFVAKHPLDGLPAVPGAERNKIKDDAMAAIATQFIGFPAKPGVVSSTENYRKAWGDKANTGVYTADDIIMVSGSGVFRGVTIADAAKVFNERYIPLVDKAIAASSKFVVGGCSGVDELLKSYVESKNYSAVWIACSYKGYWLLYKLQVPSIVADKTVEAPKATGRARSVVELDSLDWLTPYIEKLETWTANEVTALVKGLNPEQQQALRLILLGGNYVLTGNAGTGKSHLSSVAVKILKLLGYWIVPVATTGLASMNLQDSQGTINRATGVGKGFDNGARKWSAAREMVGGVTSDKTKKRFSEVQKGRKYKGVLFLIDEVSMLDTCLGYVISEGLEINQRDEAAVNKARKTPIQWLCVGDFKQLEPVGGEMIMHQAVFNHKGEEVIKASLMEKLDMKLINLKQQMRQAEGSEFAQELNLLAIGGGHGKLRELENCPLIKGRLKASLDEMPEGALHVFALRDEMIEWNRQELAKLKAKGNKSKVYSANISVNDRSYTRASFVDYFKPLEEHLELAVGAPVTIKHKIVDPNNTNAPLPLAANGSRGVIVALNDDSVDVKLRNGNIIEISRVDLHAPLDENQIPVGRFNQIPIVLAWATTFHGCQGMTEDKVVVHAYTRKRICPNDGQEVDVVLNGTEYGAKRPMFQNNAFYVGCSRVRELEDLYFYTGCDTVDLVTETKEQRNYRASTFRRLMFNSYKTNLHVINWLKEQAVC